MKKVVLIACFLLAPFMAQAMSFNDYVESHPELKNNQEMVRKIKSGLNAYTGIYTDDEVYNQNSEKYIFYLAQTLNQQCNVITIFNKNDCATLKSILNEQN